jgi:hypothetical protein
MSNRNPILLAKLLALLGFLALITCTYYLRSEVLALSHIRFSADEVRDAESMKQRRESYPDRMKQHEAALKQYELQQEHYRQMLDLYENNYDEYVKRIEDKYELPQPPYAPTKPNSPEVAEKLYDINAQFRARKSQYFATSSRLNWLACAAALMLVGGLLYLLMFDTNGQRWHYLVALVISFVFLIGPAFHSIMTGIIGFLKEPGVF